jgi:hypothetical protein
VTGPVRRGDVIVPLARNPFEVFLYGLCVLSGVQHWDTKVEGLPGWVAWPWYGLLVVGGAVALVGEYWRDAITGLLVTRSACVVLGFGAYAWAVVTTAKIDGPVAGLVVAAFGVVAHRRAWQISVLLRTRKGRP